MAALALDPGCSAVCKGPGCEASYPQGRLSVLDGRAPGALDAWKDATSAYLGGAADGTGWSVEAASGRFVIGEPDTDRVIAWSSETDAVVSTWNGTVGSEFGASQYAQLAPDGSGGFDLWVGAPGDDYGRGAVELFRSADATTDRSDPDLVLYSKTANDRFGERIVACADLDGDKIPEIAVTAPFFSVPGNFPYAQPDEIPNLAGAVFLLLSTELNGKRGRYEPWPDLARVWWGTTEGQGAGSAILCDRDLDGDDVVDVVIGSPWTLDGRGQVQLLANPLPDSGALDTDRVAKTLLGPQLDASGADASEFYGLSLAALDRVKLAGSDQGETLLAIGATGFDLGSGRVHLIRGADLGGSVAPRDVADFQAPSGRGGLADHFGRWLASGDLDGDGLDDLVVGAPDARGPTQNAFDTGGIWVFYGADAALWGPATAADLAGLSVNGTEPFQRVGEELRVSDVDGDGLQELLVPTREVAPDVR